MGRYPPIRKHILAKSGRYENRLKEEIRELKRQARTDPKRAFNRLLQLMNAHPVTGLLGAPDYDDMNASIKQRLEDRQRFGGEGPGSHIVIAGDIDDTGYLNTKTGLGHGGVNSVFGHIGDLLRESFADSHVYHPRGDEFRIVHDIDGLNQEEARQRFIRMLQGCLEVSNKLASTGFYGEGWEDTQRVQPTMSFGMSTTDDAADGLLTHVKSGASSGKPLKYSITLDRDLRHDLGLTPESMNQLIHTLKRGAGPAHQGLLDTPEVTVFESKMPMEDAGNRKGAVVLEASYGDITDKKRLRAIRGEKNAYTKERPGTHPGIWVGGRLRAVKENG
jgi:GGDEF domain-containing protein